MLAIGARLMRRAGVLAAWTNLARHRTAPGARHLKNIVEINRRGTTVCWSEQNAHMALLSPSAGYVLETGRVVLRGHGRRNLAANDEVRRVIWEG